MISRRATQTANEDAEITGAEVAHGIERRCDHSVAYALRCRVLLLLRLVQELGGTSWAFRNSAKLK